MISALVEKHVVFISTAGSSEHAPLQERIRWRQDETKSAFQVYQFITNPEVAQTYCPSAAAIDLHNRARQADLGIENVFWVRDWSFRVRSSLLEICFEDVWLAYKLTMGARAAISTNQFYLAIAHELIDNLHASNELIQEVFFLLALRRNSLIVMKLRSLY